MLRNQSERPNAPAVAAAPAAVRKPVFGPRAVGSFVPRVTKPAFEKYGFSAAALITDWAEIIGADLARSTAPERLKWPTLPRGDAGGGPEVGRPGATLLMRVDQGRALDIQYKSRQIIERINAYFGYRAVADLRIIQAPIERRADPRTPPAPPRTVAPPPAEVAAIQDAGLREALARMAAGLRERAARGR